MSKITIRKANMSDAGKVAEVMLEFYNMDNLKEATHAFESEMHKHYNYILAQEGHKVVGFVTWLSHGLPKHGLVELDRICLLADCRGKGVGKLLVDYLINDARKWYSENESMMRKLYLLTHEDNSSAHIFYEKVGFNHEATLKSHYYDEKDERLYSIFFIEGK